VFLQTIEGSVQLVKAEAAAKHLLDGETHGRLGSLGAP
jgi:hypothetical protein